MAELRRMDERNSAMGSRIKELHGGVRGFRGVQRLFEGFQRKYEAENLA
jgi:hypothetical protein